MSEKRVTRKITLEGANLIFKNFQGKPSQYNREGERNFCVVLNEELAEELAAEGWNVKRRKPRPDDPDQIADPYLKVNVRFDPYPPVIMLITSAGKMPIDEGLVDQLDWTPARNYDLIITPYNYAESNGRPAGVSAYLKALYVTVNEDPLAMKYADIPYVESSEEGD